MKKVFVAAVALICMTMTSVLTSCGGSDDDNTSNPGVDAKAFYTLTLTPCAGAVDQMSLIKTVVSYPNGNGTIVEKEMIGNSLTITPDAQFSLPASIRITVKETFKDGVVLDETKKYIVGLYYNLTVDGPGIDYIGKRSEGLSRYVDKDDIMLIYPRTSGYIINVDAQGKISINRLTSE